jgi:glyoxalase family protein
MNDISQINDVLVDKTAESEDSPIAIPGLHHVTAIASDPQRNLDFYIGVLGFRFVKRTVNFDDPGSYHFYFADGRGTPGTILTFFAWPGAPRGRMGSGEVAATTFAIPAGSIAFWLDRLKSHQVKASQPFVRFGQPVISFLDPDGMVLELIGVESVWEAFSCSESEIPPEHALRGFHSVSAIVDGYERTAGLLVGVFGYHLSGNAGNRFRFETAGQRNGPGECIDLLCIPEGLPSRIGAGSVHHIAFRAKDDAEQLEWRKRLVSMGYNVSPVMDRTYFHSIYFREPGGVLFEIATDPPGFTEDEILEELGQKLSLPPWMENSREQIEQSLPLVVLPAASTP